MSTDKQESGMVLLTTIIMIVILTMLVLTLMQTVCLYIKISNQVVIRHETLYQLEAAAHQLIRVKNDPNCMVTDEDLNQVVDWLLHKRGCSFKDNNHQYHYVIDDLGLYPCLQIVFGKQKYSSHHWLISIASEPPRQDILQLRVTEPVRAISCDVSSVHQINSGVISWRYLPYVG